MFGSMQSVKLGTHLQTKPSAYSLHYMIRVQFLNLNSLLHTQGKHIMNHSTEP